MHYHKMSEEKFPPIALGTWAWGSGVNGGKMIFGNAIDETELKAAFDLAIKEGFYLWDTAPVYGMGSSEKRLGAYFKASHNTPKLISTKFMPFPLCPKFVFRKTVTSSLRRLQVESIDIFWIHTAYNSKKWIKEVIPFIKKNKIKYVGVSNHNLTQIKEIQSILAKENIPLSAVQNHYSLIYRTSEKQGIIDWCKENDVLFFAYMILEQGALTGVYTDANPFPKGTLRAKAFPIAKLKLIQPLLDDLGKLATNYQTSITAIVIAWAIQKGTLPIIGITKQRHITALIEAKKIKLTEEEMILLDKVSSDIPIDAKGSWEGKDL